MVHAAAYKHVKINKFDEAVKNNVIGTENVINECIANGVKKFILVSTDKAINPRISWEPPSVSLNCAAMQMGHRPQLAARFGNGWVQAAASSPPYESNKQ